MFDMLKMLYICCNSPRNADVVSLNKSGIQIANLQDSINMARVSSLSVELLLDGLHWIRAVPTSVL